MGTAAYLRALLRRVYAGTAEVFDPAAAAAGTPIRRSSVPRLPAAPPQQLEPRLSSVSLQPRAPLSVVMAQQRAHPHSQPLAKAVRVSSSAAEAAPSRLPASHAPQTAAWETLEQVPASAAVRRARSPPPPHLLAQPTEAEAREAVPEAVPSDAPRASSAAVTVKRRTSVSAPAPPPAPLSLPQPQPGIMDASVAAALRALEPLSAAAAAWDTALAPSVALHEARLRGDARRAAQEALPPFDAHQVRSLLAEAAGLVARERAFMLGVGDVGDGGGEEWESDEGDAAPHTALLLADSADADFEQWCSAMRAQVARRAEEETRSAAAEAEAHAQARAPPAPPAQHARGRASAPAGRAAAVVRPAIAPARPAPPPFGSHLPRFPSPPPRARSPSAGAEEGGGGTSRPPPRPRPAGSSPPKGIKLDRLQRRAPLSRRRGGVLHELRLRMERLTAAAAGAAVTATAASLAGQREAAERLQSGSRAAVRYSQHQQPAAPAPPAAADAAGTEVLESLVRTLVASETARAMSELRLRLSASGPSAAALLPPDALHTPTPTPSQTPKGGTPMPLMGSVRAAPSAARRAAERVLSQWRPAEGYGHPGSPMPQGSSGDSSGGRGAQESTPSGSTPSSGWSAAGGALPPRLRHLSPDDGEAASALPASSQAEPEPQVSWPLEEWEAKGAARSSDAAPSPDSLTAAAQAPSPEGSPPYAQQQQQPEAAYAVGDWTPLALTQPSLRLSGAEGRWLSDGALAGPALLGAGSPGTRRLLRDWQLAPLTEGLPLSRRTAALSPDSSDGSAEEDVAAALAPSCSEGEEEGGLGEAGQLRSWRVQQLALRRSQLAASRRRRDAARTRPHEADADAASERSHSSSSGTGGSNPTGLEVMQSVVARLRLPRE